jgi:hypothetical protein
MEITEEIREEEKKKVATTEETEPEKLDDYYIAKKLVQLKQSADSRKIEFSLKFSTVKRLLGTKTCFYTGKVFAKTGKNSRTIDRVDSSRGYVDDNVVSCTLEINTKKSNLTSEEIFLLSKRIEKHASQKIKRKN